MMLKNCCNIFCPADTSPRLWPGLNVAKYPVGGMSPKRGVVDGITGMFAGLHFLAALAAMNIFASALAAPVGNPSRPDIEQFNDTPFSIGTEADYISERQLEAGNEETTLKGAWYAGKISYSWFDRVDTYVLLGAMDWSVREKLPSGTDIKYFTDMDFAWGYGTDILLLKTRRGFGLGVSGRYRQQRPDINKIKINNVIYNGLDGRANFKEWQAGVAVFVDMSEFTYTSEAMRFIPYTGVKFSKLDVHTEAKISGTEYKVDKAKAEDNVGLFIGFDLYLSNVPKDEEIGLNVEARVMDETAFSAAVNYKF
ncbi:MAG: hypothetical protein KJ893_07095 [Candidatus Omnitrophica bacterium]|nr:hypothetical protein [Candidatus Omnitrophota bacterium]MBU4477895.1 hypothetical protein [Candidatus Omnitrophota bacterium]MCG2704209.1 hypothetical protein [Candidatus Omnitrophota bacterium]